MIQPLRRSLAVLLLTMLPAGALAEGRVSFGGGFNPVDTVAAANVTVPMFTTGEAQHAARADVSYAFRGLPAVSVTYLLRDATAERLETYLGGGAGVAFVTSPTSQPVFSLHALAGANYRIVGGLGAYGEVIAGGNRLATNLRFALGLSYTVGGS